MLKVEHLSKSYGENQAIKDLTFEVEKGEFVCIVGPSGCGKTTLLKCLSGLLEPSSGLAALNGERISGPPRDLALVFQDYSRSLLPWDSVEGNVRLPLKAAHVSKREQKRRTSEALDAVGLAKFAKHYPWQLSGGMQQRVAIARAIAYEPQLLVMDEPFASVDAQTRSDLEDLILKIHADFGITVVFVTHDIDESVYLADRVLVLSPAPTEVREVVTVNLPRPRTQVETKEQEEFVKTRTYITKLIKTPVLDPAAN